MQSIRDQGSATWRLARHWLLLLLAVVSYPESATALDPNLGFHQYVVRVEALKPEDDGVPTDIAQDNAGFLWVAKTDGLVRFDGDYRRNYQVADYSGLHSNFIRKLYVTTDGRLIVVTSGGVSVVENGRLSSLFEYSDKRHFMNTATQTPDGNLLFGGDSGAYRFENKQLRPAWPQISGKAVYAFQWFDDALWIAGEGSIWSIRDEGVYEFPMPALLQNQSIVDMAIHQGQLWFATDVGIWRLRNDTLVRFDEVDRTEAVSELLSDKNGSLWFGGTDIMGRVLPDGRVENIDFAAKKLGARPGINALHEDSYGGLWIAKDDGRVTGISDSNVARLSVAEGLPLARVNAIAVTSTGEPLIGHDLGASIASPRSVSSIFSSDANGGVSGVVAVMKNAGNFWFGSATGVAVFSATGTEITPDTLNKGISNPVQAILAQTPERVWIGTTSGLYQWEYDSLFNGPYLPDHRIESLHDAPDGRLWVGTDQGLYYRRDNEFIAVAELPIPEFATITSITTLPDGHIAAAVRDHGLLVGRNEDWRLLTKSNELPSDSAFFIGVTPGGYLWGVTSSGVYRVPASELTDSSIDALSVRVFLSARSAFRPEVDSACCMGTRHVAAAMFENKLYVASTDGLLEIDTRNIREPLASPTPYFRSRTKNLSGGWRSFGDTIELTAEETFLRIRFSAIQLMNGDNVRYRYRLGNESWTEIGRDTTVVLSNLAPGQQRFEVGASIRPGEWGNSTSSTTIIREPKFSETVYFRLLIGLALAAIYVALIWLRALWLRRRVNHIESVIHHRTADLNSLNTELLAANAALEKISHSDALTGMHNRHYLHSNEDILGMGATPIKEQDAYTAIVLLDIDFFKRINDEHGHLAGDTVLQQLSDLLAHLVRSNDEVIRWGGEEFLLLLRYREGQLAAILERICKAVRNHDFHIDNKPTLDVVASAGAIAAPTDALREHPGRLDDLIECADLALYSVKRNGRDGWAGVFADGPNFHKALVSNQLADDLLDLVQTDTFEWMSNRPEIQLDADNSVIQLQSVRTHKDQFDPDRTSTNIGGKPS